MIELDSELSIENESQNMNEVHEELIVIIIIVESSKPNLYHKNNLNLL